MAFVFYDLETTGTDTRHDQILHFAAIRTDAELNEEDRVELRCRLDRHVVPHPEALVLTRRSLEEVRHPALPSHYEMMVRVARRLEGWSPATVVGFNSIRFDEEMLRHALWRTLHDPYLTSRNGNVRADALTLCRTVAFLTPGALEVPVDADGRPRFTLELLSRSNGLGVTGSHAAMNDAEATLGLCRLVMRRDGETWSRFLRFASKAATAALIDSGQPFGAVRFRGNEPRAAAAVLVGRPALDFNRRYCLDLSHDPDVLEGVADVDLRSLLSRSDGPVFRLRVNACPAVCELWDLPHGLRGGVDDGTCEVRAARLTADGPLVTRVMPILEELDRTRQTSEYLEEQLYDALPEPVDVHLLRRFHQVDWADRVALLPRLVDPRTRRLGRRLIHLEASGALPVETRKRFDAEIAGRLGAPAGSVPYRTVADALAAARDMRARCPPSLVAALAALA